MALVMEVDLTGPMGLPLTSAPVLGLWDLLQIPVMALAMEVDLMVRTGPIVSVASGF